MQLEIAGCPDGETTAAAKQDIDDKNSKVSAA